MKYLFFISCLLMHQSLHVSSLIPSYNYVTTIQASIPNIQDEFGSEFSLVVNGTTLILAASVPNLVTDPHVEIFKSEDNGVTWIYSQSILCCPTSPSLDGKFVSAFSENGTMLLIGNPTSRGGQEGHGGAMLYDYSDGQYVNTSQDITCNAPGPVYLGESVALSGDRKWTFVVGYSGIEANLIYTNTQTNQCFLVTLTNVNNLGSIAANFDGSTLIISYTLDEQYFQILVYTDYSYQSSTNMPITLNFNYPITLSLTRDGSIFAVGLCGCCVNIYNISDLTSPTQIITPPPVSNTVPFGCNVVLSDDGSRLIVGSNGDNHGYSYAYKRIGGVYQFDMLIIPPFTNCGGGGGDLAIINTPGNTSVVLIGGPTSGLLESGQIAVFKSVPAMSVTATPTASAMSTYSATYSSTASPSSSSSATTSSTASATGTSTATPTSNSTTTPSSQPNDNIQPGANSPLLGITTGISITGGIFGSIIGYFLIRWIRKWYKSNKSNKKNYTPYISIESINNETSSTGKESLITELYST